jgi:hypothetical protein
LTGALGRRLHTAILVIQKVRYADQRTTPRLSPKFALVPVLEYQNGGDHFIRISKVAPPPMPAPFARPAAPAALRLPPAAPGRTNVSLPPGVSVPKQK